MPSTDWFNILDLNTRIRARMIRDDHGNITAFTVQLEHFLDEIWRPVVRYDSAHGQAHIDYLTPNGEEYNKVWLGTFAPFNTVFTIASNELAATYADHIAHFLTKGVR